MSNKHCSIPMTHSLFSGSSIMPLGNPSGKSYPVDDLLIIKEF